MQNCSFSRRDHVWLVGWFTKITSLNKHSSCVALFPLEGRELWASHGYPRGRSSSPQRGSQLKSQCLPQTMTSGGCTQAKANLATPFVPGMPTFMQASTAHSIREAIPIGEPREPSLTPTRFHLSPNSPRSSKWCCPWQAWPVRPRVWLLDRPMRTLFPGNLEDQHTLNMLSTEYVLHSWKNTAPRNSLIVSNNMASPRTWP